MPVSRVFLVALLGLGYWGTSTVEGIEIFMYIRISLGQLRRRLSGRPSLSLSLSLSLQV